MNTTTTIGVRLSRQGLRAMYAGSVTNGQEQGVIGESYLNSIRDQADVSAEQAVAKAASTAWRTEVVGPCGSLLKVPVHHQTCLSG